jgi:hypothetical protein
VALDEMLGLCPEHIGCDEHLRCYDAHCDACSFVPANVRQALTGIAYDGISIGGGVINWKRATEFRIVALKRVVQLLLLARSGHSRSTESPLCELILPGEITQKRFSMKGGRGRAMVPRKRHRQTTRVCLLSECRLSEELRHLLLQAVEDIEVETVSCEEWLRRGNVVVLKQLRRKQNPQFSWDGRRSSLSPRSSARSVAGGQAPERDGDGDVEMASRDGIGQRRGFTLGTLSPDELPATEVATALLERLVLVVQLNAETFANTSITESLHAALEARIQVVFVHDSDPLHGGCPFAEATERCPEALKALRGYRNEKIFDRIAVEWARGALEEVSVRMLALQIGAVAELRQADVFRGGSDRALKGLSSSGSKTDGSCNPLSSSAAHPAAGGSIKRGGLRGLDAPTAPQRAANGWGAIAGAARPAAHIAHAAHGASSRSHSVEDRSRGGRASTRGRVSTRGGAHPRDHTAQASDSGEGAGAGGGGLEGFHSIDGGSSGRAVARSARSGTKERGWSIFVAEDTPGDGSVSVLGSVENPASSRKL